MHAVQGHRRINGPKLKELTPCGYCFQEWASCYDHVMPVAHGGTNRKSNLYPSCQRCNAILSAAVFKSLNDKRNYIRQKLKGRGLWLTSTEMSALRGAFQAEESSQAEVLPLSVPMGKLAKTSRKAFRRRGKRHKWRYEIKRDVLSSFRALVRLDDAANTL